LPQCIRAVALIGLCLLPVQMRAGTDRPHPHSLFQLLLDVSDGKIDHHALDDPGHAVPHDDHEHAAGQPDPPVYSDVMDVSASLAVLATIAALLAIPAATAARIWPTVMAWQGRIPTLEPPPPRGLGL
jgi:hypothetical protein